MPMYEFECKSCGHVFEDLVFDDDSSPCPKCGSDNTAKLMSCCAHTSGGQIGDTGASHSHGGGCSCGSCSGGNCASCAH